MDDKGLPTSQKKMLFCLLVTVTLCKCCPNSYVPMAMFLQEPLLLAVGVQLAFPPTLLSLSLGPESGEAGHKSPESLGWERQLFQVMKFTTRDRAHFFFRLIKPTAAGAGTIIKHSS